MMSRTEYPVRTEQIFPPGLLHPAIEVAWLKCPVRTKGKARIFHISDLHYGNYPIHSLVPGPRQKEISDTIVRFIQNNLTDNPDNSIIVFTGDLSTKIDDFPGHRSASEEILRDRMAPFLKLEIPKLAVLGNHDTHSDVAKNVLSYVGFDVGPVGQNHPVHTNLLNAGISFWTLPDFYSQYEEHQRHCQVIRDIGPGINPNIVPVVVTHNSSSFTKLSEDLIFVGLAGHAHGGVFESELLNEIALRKLGIPKEIASGFFQQGKAVLYVSNGAGRCPNAPILPGLGIHGVPITAVTQVDFGQSA